MNIGGIISGFDSLGLIDATIEIGRTPIYRMQERQTEITDQITAWQALNTKLLAFGISCNNLKSASSWDVFSCTSSDEDILTASADSSAPLGVYSFTVNQLAANHQIASNGFADTDETTIGTGTFTLELGDNLSTQIEIDETNNTLEGLRNAINDSTLDVTATIINTGSGDTPYQLMISSDETGADNQIACEIDLDGGTSLYFMQIGTVNAASGWLPDPPSSTSAITSGGSYIGTDDKTYTVTATSSGTIGTDAVTLSWDDGTGNSGTITVPADYDTGDPSEIAVGDDGVTLTFGAGDIVSGENFTVDVESGGQNTIQEGKDAEVIFGGSGSGDNPITITSSSNTVTDLIEGVTLNLLSADSESPVTLTIGRDTEQLVTNIETMISNYSEVMTYINSQMAYDEFNETGGVLMGDLTLLTIQNDLKNTISQKITGLPDGFQLLSEIGIESTTTGTLTIDSSTLSSKIEEDFESFAAIFNESGGTTDNDIRFLTAGTDTIESSDGYFINITRAATQATTSGGYFQLDGDAPLTITDANNRIKVKIDGESSGIVSLSTGTYTSGEALASMIETQLQESSLDEDALSVEWEEDSGDPTRGRIVINSASYGSNSSVEIVSTSSSIYSDIGLTAGTSTNGKDVAGSINGEAATGSGRILTGLSGNATTDGLAIEVNLTADQLTLQGGSQGRVSFSRGIASDFSSILDRFTDTSDGIITSKTDGLEKQIEIFDEHITRIEEQLEIKRERLIAKYTAMEQTIALLETQSQILTQQFALMSSSSSSN